MRIAPFDPLCPPADRVARVASVPYDVVTTAEARHLAEGNPISFLHVIRAEIDLPESTDPHADIVYDHAAANFAALQRAGALSHLGRRGLFVYRQVMGAHEQRGLVCCCHSGEYDRDLIKKHEKTRPDKENDRTRHMRAIRAHAGPVFLTIRDTDKVARLLDAAVAGEPMYDFTAPDGVRHTVWEAGAVAPWVAAFEAVPCAYVADGHHRSASASRTAAQLRAENPGDSPDAEYNWFLSVIFPASELRILAYNRVVRGLNGHTPAALLEAVGGALRVVGETKNPIPERPGRLAMFLGGRWIELEIPDAARPADDPVGRLDVAVLADRVMDPLLGIADQRTSDRIDFVGGIHGAAKLEKLAREAGEAVAFSLHPVTVDELMAIADAGAIMPPKSTWFEPKLRSGLLVHTF